MIILASHKTFKKRIEESGATVAFFLYSDKAQRKRWYDSALKRNVRSHAIVMNNVYPGRCSGKQLPTVDAIIDLIKMLSKHKNDDIVIADPRGKHLCTSFAIIARYLNCGASRKSVTDIMHDYPKTVANGFVLMIADSILGSSLYSAATTFGKCRYIALDIDEENEIEEESEPKPKQTRRRRRKPVEPAAEAATIASNEQKTEAASNVTPKADKPVEAGLSDPSPPKKK
jgi:hypothetical protein